MRIIKRNIIYFLFMFYLLKKWLQGFGTGVGMGVCIQLYNKFFTKSENINNLLDDR